MNSLLSLLSDCIKAPLKNWYHSLSDRTRSIVDKIVVILVSLCIFLAAESYLVQHSLRDFDAMKTETHEEGTAQRMDCQASIYNNLQNLLVQTNAKRACIVEMHNGVNNPSGLPYLYGEMTYEQPAEGIPFIGDSFQKVTLSTYKMGLVIHNKYEWFGNTEQLKNVDNKLYSYLKATDVTYIGVIALHSKKCEIGFLILTFSKAEMSTEEQHQIAILMAQYANYIAPDLTMVLK